MAYDASIDQISKSLGVDDLHYISIPGLISAFQTDELCMACLDGDYPTKDQSFIDFLASRRIQRRAGEIRS